MVDLEQKIGAVTAPISYLFINYPEIALEQLIEYFKSRLSPDKQDIKIIRGEESENKDKRISIKQIRELNHWLNLSPIGQNKIAILVQADRMKTEAANALLKNLEEPAKNSVLILLGRSDKILATIRSRCRVVYFISSNLSDQNILNPKLKEMLDKKFVEQSKYIEKIVKNGKEEQCLDELLLITQKSLIKKPNQEIKIFMAEIIRSKQLIESNVNKRLVLENLFLKVRKIKI